MPLTPSSNAASAPSTPRDHRRRCVIGPLIIALVASVLAVVAPAAANPANAAPGVHRGGGWVDLQAGSSHSCALSAKGEVRCWGRNTEGQLGYGDVATRGDGPDQMGNNLPAVDLGTGRTATAIAVGSQYTCALLDDSSVKCWGRNGVGQLGQGSITFLGDDPNEMGDNLPPVDLGTGRTATAITAANGHTCALLDNGNVKCWGNNSIGQLGQGNTTNLGDDPNEMGDNLSPVDLGTGRTAVAVSAGATFSCALLDSGQLKCWGNNADGQLGLGDTAARGDNADEMGDNLPAVALGAGRTAVSVSTGFAHACVVLDDASMKCWGRNNLGQLGTGGTASIGDGAGEMGDALAAVSLGSGRRAVSISLGFSFSCARLDDRSVKCWGHNTDGQLGLGDTDDRGDNAGEMGDNLPTIVLGTDRIATAIEVGSRHACAVLDDNTVKCWGHSGQGKLGLGDAEDRGDDVGEMGDNLPTLDLGTAFLVDPAGVESFLPARLVETRAGEPTVDGLQQGIGRRSAGEVTEVQVTGRAGIDDQVEAAIVNIGIVNPADNGFAVGYPCDEAQPASSSINYRAGETIANAATIKLSATGTICVLTQRATDLIVDVTSVIPFGSTVEAITPARFFDSRDGFATTDGLQQAQGRRGAGQVTEVIVGGRNGVPADAEAATVNIAADVPQDKGFITAFACDEPQPTASMINYQTGRTIAGGATISLSAAGTLCVFTQRAMDLVVDVTAYTPAGAIVDPQQPARLLETRAGRTTVDGQQEGIGQRTAGEVTEVQVVNRAGVTGAATAGIFNIAVANPEAQGFAAIWPCDEAMPGSSAINFQAGQTIANNATIQLSDDGTICVYTHRATDLVVDLTATIR